LLRETGVQGHSDLASGAPDDADAGGIEKIAAFHRWAEFYALKDG
jgi:hypothetical protein